MFQLDGRARYVVRHRIVSRTNPTEIQLKQFEWFDIDSWENVLPLDVHSYIQSQRFLFSKAHASKIPTVLQVAV